MHNNIIYKHWKQLKTKWKLKWCKKQKKMQAHVIKCMNIIITSEWMSEWEEWEKNRNHNEYEKKR